MKITFKESKDSENTILVFNPNNVKIAHVNSKKRKVSICGNAVSRQLERINGVERTKETILAHYDHWVYESSPFSKLSTEELNKLQNNFIALNILGASIDNIVQEIKQVSCQVGLEFSGIKDLSNTLEVFNSSSVQVLGQDLAIDAFDISDSITEDALSKADNIRLKTLSLIK